MKKPLLFDARNCSPENNYTQIPNDLLRNPELSLKAKGLLCLLLSNRYGWETHLETLMKLTNEKEFSLRAGIKELEDAEYLIRPRIRCKKTKKWIGSIWAYTSVQGVFSIDQHRETLESQDLEIVFNLMENDNPPVEKPRVGNPHVGNHDVAPIYRSLNNKTKEKNKIKKINKKNISGDLKITKSMFPKFWELYPKKPDKGKALTAWNKLCTKPQNEKPTFEELEKAIKAQKESPRWQSKEFIPHPTTWLNQSRWLDDPAEMTTFEKNNTEKNAGFVQGYKKPKNLKNETEVSEYNRIDLEV